MKNYQAILMIIVGFGLAIGTMNGSVQNYIHFVCTLNELAFAFLTGMLGVVGCFGIDYKKILKALI